MGDTWSTRRKTSRSREENQQQTQPTYDAGSGNRTRYTLVGGERSHHCAIPALHIMLAGSRNLGQEDSFLINSSSSSLEGSHNRDGGFWISKLA